MFSRRVRSALIAATAAVGLTGCTTYGAGGLGGVSVGYGDPYGYGPYGSRYGSRYGGYGYGYGPYGGYGYNPYAGYGYPGGIGYGYPYYGGYPVYVGVPVNPNAGWYNGFFYPGSGTYVYDRKGNRYAWSDEQRAYWESRRNSTARASASTGTSVNDGMRVQRRSTLSSPQRTRTERQTLRTERRSDRIEARQLRRSERMTTRTQRRPD